MPLVGKAEHHKGSKQCVVSWKKPQIKHFERWETFLFGADEENRGNSGKVKDAKEKLCIIGRKWNFFSC